MNETTAKLFEWVKDYGIESDIREVLAEQGYDAAVDYTRAWFEGLGEAEAILEELT